MDDGEPLCGVGDGDGILETDKVAELGVAMLKLHALTGKRLWAARQSAAMRWSHPDDVPQDILNRILWWDSKGYNTPYPVLTHSSKR